MSGPSQFHQGGSEFASTITGHHVDLGNKSLTRRDTAQTINHHNYYGHPTAPLRDQEYEFRGEKRKYADGQEQVSHSHASLETLLQSLKFNQIDARHDTIRKAHAKTCKWILKRSEYLDWQDPNKVDEHHGFLWIKGKPGAGKSTVMKFLLSNARRTMKNKTIISFFFNARGEQLEKSTTGMYRSLLLQLLQQLPRLHSVVDPGLILSIGKNYDWSVEVLKTLFEQSVEGLGDSSVIVFIDALDECDESEIRSMVSSFKSLGNLSAAEEISFQVCLASRHYPHITMPKKIELVLERQEGHEQDIVSYLDSELEIGESKLANEIRAQIKEKASGIFMWVVLVSGILQQKYDKGRIHALKQTLQEIPGDLHELFRDMITRDEENKDEMLLCIQWILFASHPLRPEQLYFAIRAYIEDTTCKWDRDEITEHAIGKFILNISKGLAEVTSPTQDPIVQFIHESVRDFLLKENGLRVILSESSGNPSARSQDQLKKCCFEYMQSYTEENGTPESGSKHHLIETRVAADNGFPFLRYAVQNVLRHADTAEEGHIDQVRFLETFPIAKWIRCNNIFQDKEVRRHTTGVNLLYLLAEYNLESLIKSHQGSQSCFDIENERYGAPILAAMATGSRSTVWKLLKREIRDEPATSRLHSLCHEYDVAKRGKHRIGRNFKFNPKLGLIYYILQDDDLIVASFAIASPRAYTYPDFRTPRGETPFSVSIQHCQDVLATFRFLLENGADIEARDKHKRTPLTLATANGNAAAVAFLLGKGANVDNTCIFDMTPLIYAAARGSEECMRLLVSGGASVAATDNQGRTALAWSLRQGKATKTMVDILLSRSNTVNKPDHLGRTPLMLALGSDVVIMKHLMDRGAEIDSIDNQGYSALLLAVMTKAERQTRLLLDRGACVDVYDASNNRTALSYAVTSARYDKDHSNLDGFAMRGLRYWSNDLWPAISEALLNSGAAVNAADGNGRTPLSYAAEDGAFSVMSIWILLKYGADINAADNWGRTPLSYAASRHSNGAACVKLLLDQGASPDIVDVHGYTALSYATNGAIQAVLQKHA